MLLTYNIAPILFVLISGCTSGPLRENLVPMDCSKATTFDVRNITWIPSNSAAGIICRDHNAIGCTACVGTSCTVFMPEPGDVSDMVAGHELKHAFGCAHK